jgi:transcriptional regulator with XRE-family HTH domain
MLYTPFTTPHEASLLIASAAKSKRLELNFSQSSLAERSGVSLGSIKIFEANGKISLQSLLKIALILDCMDEFLTLFQKKPMESYVTIDEALKTKTRKRGRR